MTKENVVPMQFLYASCLGSCNFPNDNRSEWNLSWGLSLNPLLCPNQFSPRHSNPLSPGEKPSLLEAPRPFIGAPWLELSNPFFLCVTWFNISTSHVPWETKVWASILGELCVCQGKWVITQGNWDFKVPFLPQDNLVGYFKSLCSVIKFWAQILGEPCVS
jgi:hypothetical protein